MEFQQHQKCTFSSKFSIDNLLNTKDNRDSNNNTEKTEDYDTTQSAPKTTFEVHNSLKEHSKTWRPDDIMSKILPPELSLSSDDRYHQTQHWIERTRFERPKSLPLLAKNNLPPTEFTPKYPVHHGKSISDLSLDYRGILHPFDPDMIPSPSATEPLRYSPSEVFSRQAMESWFYRSRTCGPYGDKRRGSPDLRTSPYRSWGSSLSSSSDREGLLSALPRHHTPAYYPIHDDDLDDANRKGGQVRFSHSQSSELERVFNIQKYISPQERKQLARGLDLSERQVKTWFQNRRAKWRRVKLEDEMRAKISPGKTFLSC